MNLNNSDIVGIMAEGSYGVCYEPIIELKSMDTIGYEALSRFKHKGKILPPDIFFKTIHNNNELFFYVESILKKFQLKHRVDNKTLFLNLDPDVSINETQVEFWVDLFQNSKNVVIEIIENSDEESVEDIENFMEWLETYQLPFAYDDFGKPNAIFFASLLHRANYIKLDIYFLQTITKELSYIEVLRGMVKFAKLKGKKTILEGVQREEDLQIAKDVDVDYVQGYLFKNEFISVWN